MLVGCGDKQKSAPDLSPVEAPDTPILFEGRLEGKETLPSLRAQLDQAHEVMVPHNVFAMVSTIFDLPNIVADYVDNERLHMVSLLSDDSGSDRLAFSFRLAKEPDGAFAEMLSPGAPRNGQWIRPCGSCVAVVLNRIVVVASDEKALRATIGYLATKGLQREYPKGISVRVPKEVLSGHLRKQVRKKTDEMVSFFNGALEEERKRHKKAPEVGDPAAFLRKATDFAYRWTGYLADVDDLQFHLAVHDAGIIAKLNSSVKSNTPFSNEIAKHPLGSLTPLLQSLNSTSMAFLSSGPSTSEQSWFEPVVGKQLSSDEKKAMLEAMETVGDSRGALVISAGATENNSPYLMMSMPDTKRPVDKLKLKDGVSADYVTGVLGMMRSCQSVGRFQGDVLEVCNNAAVKMAGAGDDFALAFGVDNPNVDGEDVPLRAVRAMQDEAQGSWSTNGDLARLYGEDVTVENVIVALGISPGIIPATTSLLAAFPSTPLGSAHRAPTILSVLNDGKEDGRQKVSLDMRIAQGGLSPLIQLLRD